MEWMPSQHMNTVDLKAVIASWGLYAPHGAEKPELRTFVNEKYKEIMAERVKQTSILVQSTVVRVDKSVGTEAPRACTTYIGADEPISTKSHTASDATAEDEIYHQIFADEGPFRTSPFRMMSYDSVVAASSSSQNTQPKAKPKAKPAPKPEKPGRVIRDDGDIYV